MAEHIEEYGFMRRCFELAYRGLGSVAPNPMVGCVIVKNGMVMAEGYHQFFGGPHAEIEALQNLKKNKGVDLGDLVMYVSLEPCNHHGKTPPCTSAIIKSGITKIVISNLDPNPLVAGKGLTKLISSGLQVTQGFLSAEGAELNKRFFVFHQKKRPFIILKWAKSADGFMAPSSKFRGHEKAPFWISSDASRKMVQKWRSEEQAILVGKNTVLDDDPRLTCRFPGGKTPTRIVIDPSLSLSMAHKVFQEKGRIIVLNNRHNTHEGNIEYLRFKKNDIGDMLTVLYESGIQSMIVEGGKYTLDRFIESGFWDEARVFTAPNNLNDGLAAPLLDTDPVITEQMGEDTLKIFQNKTEN